jgi:hypothetical protein
VPRAPADAVTSRNPSQVRAERDLEEMLDAPHSREITPGIAFVRQVWQCPITLPAKGSTLVLQATRDDGMALYATGCAVSRGSMVGVLTSRDAVVRLPVLHVVKTSLLLMAPAACRRSQPTSEQLSGVYESGKRQLLLLLLQRLRRAQKQKMQRGRWTKAPLSGGYAFHACPTHNSLLQLQC